MLKTLWITLTVLFVAIGAPNAHADSYTDGTINFTVTAGNVAAAPTGSFVYDNTTNEFTDLTVHWTVLGFEIIFPLTGCANGTGYGASVIVCTRTSDGQTSYQALTSCKVGTTETCTWWASTCFIGCYDDSFRLSSGEWLIAEIHLDASPYSELYAVGTFTTPEPSSFGLMLLGIGLVLVMRKRMAQGLPRAT
jgi:hypothetical protein